MSYKQLSEVPNSLLPTTAIVARCSSLMSLSFLNPMKGENTSIRASFKNAASNVRIGARLKKTGGKKPDRVPVVSRFLYLGWDERDTDETIGVLIVYAEMFPEIERMSKRKPMTKDEMLEIMWANGFDTVDVDKADDTPPVAYVPVGIILRHGKHNEADASRSDWHDDVKIALNESCFENPKHWGGILYKDDVAIGGFLEIHDEIYNYFKVSVVDMYDDTIVAVTTAVDSFVDSFRPGVRLPGKELQRVDFCLLPHRMDEVFVVRDIGKIDEQRGHLFDKFDFEVGKQLKVIVYPVNPYPYDEMFDAEMFDPYCPGYFARLVCIYDMRHGYIRTGDASCSYLDRLS